MQVECECKGPELAQAWLSLLFQSAVSLSFSFSLFLISPLFAPLLAWFSDHRMFSPCVRNKGFPDREQYPFIPIALRTLCSTNIYYWPTKMWSLILLQRLEFRLCVCVSVYLTITATCGIMQFGINVLCAKAERYMCKTFLFLSCSKNGGRSAGVNY